MRKAGDKSRDSLTTRIYTARRHLREWGRAYSEPSHLFAKGSSIDDPISKPPLPGGKKGERADIRSEQPLLCICTAVIDLRDGSTGPLLLQRTCAIQQTSQLVASILR